MARLAENSLDLNTGIIWDNPDPRYQSRERTDVLCNLFERALHERSSQDLDNLIGALLLFGAADGYAMYIVTKARPLTLMHVYLGDGYQVQYPMIKGIDANDVRQMREVLDGSRGWRMPYSGEITDEDRQYVADKLHELLPRVFDGTPVAGV